VEEEVVVEEEIGGGRRISWVGFLKRVASWVAWVEVGERARRRLEGGGRIEVDMVGWWVEVLCLGLVVVWW
jgi:hypothetical protein